MRYLSPRPNAGAPTHTAIIADVAAAEPVVGEHRLRFDPAAGWGVPAHVTIVYPFVDPVALDEQVIATLADVVGSINAFDCQFSRTRWFGDDVLWLAPEPAVGFDTLITAVSDAFPDHQPYGGAHDEVVAHLTVAERRLADLNTLQAVERAIQPTLPVSARIEKVLLITGAPEPQSWRIVRELPCAPPKPQNGAPPHIAFVSSDSHRSARTRCSSGIRHSSV